MASMVELKKATASCRNFRGLAPEARRQQRRDRLIEAGIEAFGTRGFYSVTVREICAEAHLTERYFYESFRSLEDLFTAVFGCVNIELRQATLDALATPTGDPVAVAEAALRVFFKYVRDDPRRGRVLLIESANIGYTINQLTNEITRDYMELVRGFINTLFPSVEPRGLNPDLLSAGLIGANVRIATTWVQEGFQTSLENVLFTTLAIYRAMITQYGRAGSGMPRPVVEKAEPPATSTSTRRRTRNP